MLYQDIFSHFLIRNLRCATRPASRCKLCRRRSARGSHTVVGNGGIVHIVCIETVVGLIFFSPAHRSENALKGFRGTLRISGP